MDPINYLSQQMDPLGGLMSGFQAGASLQGLRQQQVARELELKQQQQAQDRVEQYRTMFSDYMADPKFAKLQALRATFPEQDKAFAPLIEQMDKRQLAAEQAAGIQITTALKNNNSELATKILDENIEAAKNSGLDTTAFEQVKQAVIADPRAALGITQWLTMHTMTPEQQEKFAKAQQTLEETQQSKELFPSKLRETTAKAGTAESEQAIKSVEAKYIEPKTVQAIQKSNLDMKKILADIDIAKQNARIAAMNAQTNRETNSLKRQELGIKVAEAQTKLNDSIREKVASADSAISTSDNILNSIDRILAVPKGVRESAHGPISSMIKTVRSDTADYEALLDTLGSQSFLAQIASMKGMGALSDAEGKKLQAGMQNLSLTQSAEQAEKNVREMKKLMVKARKNIEVKYGIKANPPESSFMSNENAKSVFDKYGIK